MKTKATANNTTQKPTTANKVAESFASMVDVSAKELAGKLDQLAINKPRDARVVIDAIRLMLEAPAPKYDDVSYAFISASEFRETMASMNALDELGRLFENSDGDMVGEHLVGAIYERLATATEWWPDRLQSHRDTKNKDVQISDKEESEAPADFGEMCAELKLVMTKGSTAQQRLLKIFIHDTYDSVLHFRKKGGAA